MLIPPLLLLTARDTHEGDTTKAPALADNKVRTVSTPIPFIAARHRELTVNKTGRALPGAIGDEGLR